MTRSLANDPRFKADVSALVGFQYELVASARNGERQGSRIASQFDLALIGEGSDDGSAVAFDPGIIRFDKRLDSFDDAIGGEADRSVVVFARLASERPKMPERVGIDIEA